ncbi:MAG: Flp pilus assembly protein CpaB [Firmicutes bacterium]|nr:Flp pilus assembly protein CpaB [Bacillota bacterium]
MKSRFMIVLLSLILAAAATLGAALYIANLKSSITEGQKLVDVVVAKKSVEAGTSVAEAYASGSISVSKIPKQYVADGALKSNIGFSNRVLSASLVPGEQLTENKLKKTDESGIAFKVPEGMLGVSIAIDEVTGVGGKLQPGDRVDVIATFSPGPNAKDMTKVMLQNVEVLATSDAGAGEKDGGLIKGQSSGIGKKTVTLCVEPINAEKLVLAAEKGHIWLGLRHSGDNKTTQSSGQDIETVFR